MKKIGKYFRELSIVVVGIAITVSIGVYVNDKGNKKDMELFLGAVKLELEQNIKDIDKQVESMQRSVEYADYLKAYDSKSFSPDALINYADAYYTVQTITYKTNAFEMFKISGAMRLMNNKELLFSIWEAYANLNELKELLSWGFQLKFEEMQKELPMIAAKKTDFIPMYTFYTATPWAYEMPRLCGDTLDILEETVSKLEKQIN